MRILDLREENGWWKFRFGSGDDFERTLVALKRSVPLMDRRWDERGKWWLVRKDTYDKALGLIFENWNSCIGAIRAQGKLW